MYGFFGSADDLQTEEPISLSGMSGADECALLFRAQEGEKRVRIRNYENRAGINSDPKNERLPLTEYLMGKPPVRR